MPDIFDTYVIDAFDDMSMLYASRLNNNESLAKSNMLNRLDIDNVENKMGNILSHLSLGYLNITSQITLLVSKNSSPINKIDTGL